MEAESVKYKEAELIRKFKERYIEDKRAELKEQRESKKKNKQAAKIAEAAPALEFPKGAVIAFSGVNEGQVLTREEIKAKVKEIGDIEPAFINYSKSEPSGYMRFPNENDAVDLHKKLTEGVLEIGEVKLALRVLEGEEEEKYLKTTAEDITKIRHAQKKAKWGKRRGHHRQGENEPSAKKAKTGGD